MANDLYKDYLMHSNHKYLDRYRGKNGKWVYVYNKPKKTNIHFKSGGYDEGERDRQKWKSVELDSGHTATVLSGSNRVSKYAGISIGKVGDDSNYVEKEKKIGGVTLYYDNENGTHNFTVFVDHKSIEKGKSIVNNILKRKS